MTAKTRAKAVSRRTTKTASKRAGTAKTAASSKAETAAKTARKPAAKKPSAEAAGTRAKSGTVAVGKKVPAFSAEATGGRIVSTKSLAGRPYVLYFYPKDDTPGCTTEGRDFAARYEDFRRAGVEVLGVSRDGLESHEKFKAKHGLPFDLISDPDETLCTLFDVIREKNMYGRKVLGVERSTFLVDASGRLVREWRKVKVPGHVENVSEAALSLKA